MNDTIVIAGGGPAGLMLAGELGLAGVRAIVLERETAPAGERPTPGTTLHARAEDLLDRRGLMDEIRAAEPVVWPRIHFGNIWIDLMPFIEEEYSLIVQQERTERVLEARALELGADIRRGHSLTGLTQDDGGVTAQVTGPDGAYELRCRYLVGCDGADSAVRRLAGIEAPPTGTPWYGVLADFEAGDEDWEWGSPTYPGGLFAVIPHPDGSGLLRLMTVEFGVEPPAGDRPPTAEELSGCIRRITGKDYALIGEPHWIHRYGGSTRLAAQYRQGNVFVAGDAAHFYYFGAGHGLNTALHDAANLGWKLAAAIRGTAPAGLLDSYHDERHPVGRRACVSTQAQMVLLHPYERVEPLREIFEQLMKFPNVERYLVGVLTDVTYQMPHTGEAHPLLGCPIPDAQLTTTDGTTSIAAALRSGRGVLFDFSGGQQDVAGVAPWADQVDVVAAEPTDAIKATAVLARPDGFVAWADTTGSDSEGLAAALGAWFGAPAIS